MSESAIRMLKKIEILSVLSDGELEVLCSLMKTEKCGKGQVLFNEGDTGDVMYFVLSGTVAISVNLPDGEVLEIAEITEGNFFGEMSIFDSAVRSATCSLKCDASVLSLKSEDFYKFIENKPEAGISIMHRMLNITTSRLQSTGAFLSEMVTWGEQARVRAITDDFTGLYNRRFLDEAITERISKARREGTSLTVVMIDLDHFGTLNNEYGQETGDKVILAAVDVFRENFREEDILARYGGDEFTFLLPDTPGEKALEICGRVVVELRKIDILEKEGGNLKKVTASMGLAACPENGRSVSEVREKADQALYRAKEAGKDQAVLWKDEKLEIMRKTSIPTIRKRNTVINNIIEAFMNRDGFLILGHKNPDEDCISSMIAVSLILKRFMKKPVIMIPENINRNFRYLVNICKYNEIEVLHTNQTVDCDISTVLFMDTPKPAMRVTFPGCDHFFNDESILKIEVDHHLGADGTYIGDEEYRLVDEASSASELVGMLAFKIKNHPAASSEIDEDELFSRNFVLAVLTGIIGDSKMGKFLKTNREKWFYRLFSSMFNEMLTQKTRKDSGNMSTMKEVFAALQKLSREEDECFKFMMKHKRNISPGTGCVLLRKKEMEEMGERFDQDTIVTVARYTADYLAEESGYVSLVVYHDISKDSNLIQFRSRRSENYRGIDLREIIDLFKIENGGGHPGAVGFRIPECEIENLDEFVDSLIEGIEKMMTGTEKA